MFTIGILDTVRAMNKVLTIHGFLNIDYSALVHTGGDNFCVYHWGLANRKRYTKSVKLQRSYEDISQIFEKKSKDC